MKKWIISALVLAGLIGLGLLIAKRADRVQTARAEYAKPIEAPAITVQTVAIVNHDFVDSLEITGEVKARRSVFVFSKVSGRVEALEVKLGQSVEANQVLARIEENDLGWREQQGVAGARAAEAGVSQAAAQREVVRVEYERAKKLHEEGALPEADFTRVQGQLNAATAAWRAAKAQVAVAQAGAGLAKEARSWTNVEAPMAGVITRRLVEVGGSAGGQPPQPLFELQDQSALRIEIDVPASAIDKLKLGESVDFTVLERPGQIFKANVTAVGKSLDSLTRRLHVELEASGELVAQGVLPAMLATVKVRLGERPQVLAAPKSALVHLADGPAVFIVRDGKAVRVTPDTAQADADFIPLSGDVKAGDRVVIAGQDGLQAGVRVQEADLKPAAAPRADGAKASAAQEANDEAPAKEPTP